VGWVLPIPHNKSKDIDMTTEKIKVTERMCIPYEVIRGDMGGLTSRVQTFAMEVLGTDKYTDHRVVAMGMDDPCFAIAADRFETNEELAKRIIIDESWARHLENSKRSQLENELKEYHRLHAKYGNTDDS
jgi:hypothetical protein